MDMWEGSAWALLVMFGFFALFAGVIGYVISSWFLMRVFDKAGVQGKWRAWVPVYNTMIFAKLGDLNPWWALVAWGATIVLSSTGIGSLFGIALFVYLALAAYRVGLKLQKDPWWVVLFVIIAPVWLGIMAFDRSRWNLAVPPAPWTNSFLRDSTVWPGIPAQTSVAPPAAPYGAYGAPSAYPPAAGYTPPPAPGYAPPPAGETAPPHGHTPPADAPRPTDEPDAPRP